MLSLMTMLKNSSQPRHSLYIQKDFGLNNSIMQTGHLVILLNVHNGVPKKL